MWDLFVIFYIKNKWQNNGSKIVTISFLRGGGWGICQKQQHFIAKTWGSVKCYFADFVQCPISRMLLLLLLLLLLSLFFFVCSLHLLKHDTAGGRGEQRKEEGQEEEEEEGRNSHFRKQSFNFFFSCCCWVLHEKDATFLFPKSNKALLHGLRYCMRNVPNPSSVECTHLSFPHFIITTTGNWGFHNNNIFFLFRK